MPVNDRYPLAEVLDACLRLAGGAAQARLRRVPDARRRQRPAASRRGRSPSVLAPREAFKVNLIPYNPTDGGFEGSSPETIEAFRAQLVERGVPATVRLTRGRDIAAACGQLAATSGRDRLVRVGLEQVLGVEALARRDPQGDVAAAPAGRAASRR